MVDDMYEPQEVDILVIGGGVFGSLTAIELSKKGFSVKLLEKNSSLMMGASLNNQNRLHLGYHYPRDLETAKQCQRGFEAFKARYPSCILGGFPNVYLISNENSNVTFEEYISFCRKANLPRNTVDLKTFEPLVNHIEGGLHTDEVIYDCKICNFSSKIKTHLNRHLKTKKHLNNEKNYVEDNDKKTTQNLKIPHFSLKIPHNTSQISHHTNKELYKCEYCNKEFSRIDNLNRHIEKSCKEKGVPYSRGILVMLDPGMLCNFKAKGDISFITLTFL